MKVRIIGDLEADLNSAFMYDSVNKDDDLDLQILAGDCGIFTSQKRFKMHKRFFESYKSDIEVNYKSYLSDDVPTFNTKTLLLKSEHDDPELFELGDSSPVTRMNLFPVDKKIIRKDNKIIVLFGGTYSKTKSGNPASSLVGNDRRFFSKQDAYKLISLLSGQKVDLFVTHQAAAGIITDIDRPHLKGKSYDEGAMILKTMLECFKPTYYVHAHHHINNTMDYNGTKVISLGNFRKNKNSTVTLEL